ncbi:glycosyltransferase family 2 protein [Mucilaginibacter sp.]|jgi:glycosyltransferase involved in cell wall biosynthesis|uniref:glycosyltransferase family 2 protein n=1 Tax=Mucilaginibacter sp. TaxID=1882438 RepID=UPI002C481523|nr:glycosyltransferase family 2 protein [Mucilaginibacter sp.]HTI60957.1 glycosyltransferase family 2 protein [Mucilaginibacter sp.]
MLEYPLVSIIIPVYNSERYLGEAIKSAIGQSWPNKEIIVIDDGSTDDSLKIANSFGQGLVVCTQKNSGASAARNHGFSKAKGDYIQFLDADDILGADKIANQLKLLQQNPGKIAVCSTVHFADGSDHTKNKPSEYEEEFLTDAKPLDFLINLWGGYTNKGSMVQPNAWLVPKAIADKAGKWNEDLSLDDDGEYFCRVILASEGIVVARETFNYYRKNPGHTLSGKRDLKALQSLYLSICLKQQHLQPFRDELTDKTMARAFASLLVLTYPQHKTLSAEIFKKIEELGGFGYLPVLGGGGVEFLKKTFGWKTARNIQYYYARVFRN